MFDMQFYTKTKCDLYYKYFQSYLAYLLYYFTIRINEPLNIFARCGHYLMNSISFKYYLCFKIYKTAKNNTVAYSVKYYEFGKNLLWLGSTH